MSDIAESGDPRSIRLLEMAGRNLHPGARDAIVNLPDGAKVTFEELRIRSLARARELVGSAGSTAPRSGPPKVFLSYNHHDAQAATSLALELDADPAVDVTIDHWDLVLRMGQDPGGLGPPGGFSYELQDQWSGGSHAIHLDRGEFEEGLREGEIDLMKKGVCSVEKLKPANSRLSLRNEFAPSVGANPFSGSAPAVVRPILEELKPRLAATPGRAAECLLLDLQHLVFARHPRTVRILAGSAHGGECSAPDPDHSQSNRARAVFELYDPFFGSLKTALLCPRHSTGIREADLDLLAPASQIRFT